MLKWWHFWLINAWLERIRWFDWHGSGVYLCNLDLNSWLWCSAKLAANSRPEVPLIPRNLQDQCGQDPTSGGRNGGGVLLFLLRLFLRFLPRLPRLVRDLLGCFLPLLVETQPGCPCLQRPGDTAALWAKSTIRSGCPRQPGERRADGVKTRVKMIKMWTLCLQTSLRLLRSASLCEGAAGDALSSAPAAAAARNTASGSDFQNNSPGQHKKNNIIFKIKHMNLNLEFEKLVPAFKIQMQIYLLVRGSVKIMN